MNVDNLEALLEEFRTYRGKGILVDTNLLLLFLVGLTNARLISTFKPTANHSFSERDFELLKRIILKFRKLATTPHILTEVSNHADRLKGEDQLKFCEILNLLVGQWEERCSPSAVLCGREDFIKFGLTDTAITELAPEKFLVITVDRKLAEHLQQKSVAVINFNHLRSGIFS